MFHDKKKHDHDPCPDVRIRTKMRHRCLHLQSHLKVLLSSFHPKDEVSSCIYKSLFCSRILKKNAPMKAKRRARNFTQRRTHTPRGLRLYTF